MHVAQPLYQFWLGEISTLLEIQERKSNDRFDGQWPFLFNAIIDGLDLREIEMSGRKITWANSRDVPTFERLDMVLASTEWEHKLPLVTVEALNR